MIANHSHPSRIASRISTSLSSQNPDGNQTVQNPTDEMAVPPFRRVFSRRRVPSRQIPGPDVQPPDTAARTDTCAPSGTGVSRPATSEALSDPTKRLT